MRTPAVTRRGRPADRSSVQTRSALIEAATPVFARRGYDGASVSELVRAAGVTPPVLYHHFGDKAGLYHAAVAHAYDVVLGALAEAAAGAPTYQEAIAALLEAAAGIHERDPELGALVAVAPLAATLDAQLRSVQAELARTRTFLEELVARLGPLSGATDEVSVNVGVVLLAGLTRLAASHPDPNGFAATVHALVQLTATGGQTT
jgi:AcrR family transcriptional regulator